MTAKPYAVKTLDELLDGPTEIEWIMPEIIPPSSAGLLAGDSGIGKSWLFMELALSIATDTPFLGHFKVRQGLVLIVDEENSELLLRNRLNKMLVSKGIKQTKDLPIQFLVGSSTHFSPIKGKNGDLTASPQFERLLATVYKQKPMMTMFDSLIRVHRARESASEEMSAAFAYVKQLIDETGTCTMFTHHMRKSNNNNGGGSGERIRGSTDIRAFCDFTLLADKSDSGLIITHDKSRWSETIAPFKVKFETDKKTKFGLKYNGQLNPTKQNPFEWLIEYLKEKKATKEVKAVARADIIIASKDCNVCMERKMDKTIASALNDKVIFRTTIGKSAAFWIK